MSLETSWIYILGRIDVISLLFPFSIMLTDLKSR